MRDLVITALDRILFIKGALFALIYIFFIGAIWFNISVNVFSNVCYFKSLLPMIVNLRESSDLNTQRSKLE